MQEGGIRTVQSRSAAFKWTLYLATSSRTLKKSVVVALRLPMVTFESL